MKSFFLALVIIGQVHLQTSSPLANDGGTPIEILPNTPNEAVYVPQYFDQKLDHFNKSNTKTWKQRYYYYSQLYDGVKQYFPSIPLFLILGGEDQVSSGVATTNSPMYRIGKDYQALMMVLEHRYYGESKPTTDISVENLKYLSSRQAVEDIVYFVEEMKKKFGMKCNNEVVVFGGSYSGALAAWVRLKHPDKINVVQSSSAPIATLYNFRGFNNVVRSSIKLYDENCASVIHDGTLKQEELVKTEEGLQEIHEKFKTCRLLTDKGNRRAFFQKQMSQIGQVVQYNGTRAQSIPDICKLLMAAGDGKDSIDRLAHYEIVTTNTIENTTCTGYDYSENVEDLRHTNYDIKDPFRQFLWQSCTELGEFMTSDSSNSFFANTLGLDFFDDRCKDVFGDKFTPEYIKKQIDQTYAYYGGFNYKQGQVLFTQGQLDPYQAAGITESNDQIGYKALVIPNVGHVRDLDLEKDSDPPQLKEARAEIKKIIKGWIKAVDFSNGTVVAPLGCNKPPPQPSSSPSNPFNTVYSYLNIFGRQ